MSIRGSIATGVEVGATALWAGASAGFAFVSAPLAFSLVADRDVFAALTERSLTRLSTLAYVAGGLATLVAVARAVAGGDARTADVARALAGTAALACILLHQRTVVPAMNEARAQLGGTFEVAPDAPSRRAYNALHRRSTRVYGMALLLGTLQLVLASTRPAVSTG